MAELFGWLGFFFLLLFWGFGVFLCSSGPVEINSLYFFSLSHNLVSFSLARVHLSAESWALL